MLTRQIDTQFITYFPPSLTEQQLAELHRRARRSHRTAITHHSCAATRGKHQRKLVKSSRNKIHSIWTGLYASNHLRGNCDVCHIENRRKDVERSDSKRWKSSGILVLCEFTIFTFNWKFRWRCVVELFLKHFIIKLFWCHNCWHLDKLRIAIYTVSESPLSDSTWRWLSILFEIFYEQWW